MAELPSDLRDLVGDILSTDGTLGMAAAELRDLAEQTHRSSFALALEVVLPLLASSTSTERQRLVGLFAISSSYADYPLHLDPFRSTYEAALVRTKWSVRADSEALNAAVLYILCGLGHLLAAFTVEDLIPFSLPTGGSFPCGASGPVLPVDTPGSSGAAGIALEDVVRCISKAIQDGLRPGERSLLSKALPRVSHLLPGLLLPGDLAGLIRHNVDIACSALRALFTAPLDLSEGVDLGSYISALAGMEVGLSGLDLLARLLQASADEPDNRLRLLVEQEVLSVYVARWVADIDGLATVPELYQELARRVRILSLFAVSLLETKVLRPGEDVTMELAGFALRYSRFADAQRLYSHLATLSD